VFTLNQALMESRIVVWCKRARCMPDYEFFCRTCNRPFSKTSIPSEYEVGKVVCPRCGSEDVQQRWFYPVAAKQSA
jgi:putative FmdB family regulatory protein